MAVTLSEDILRLLPQYLPGSALKQFSQVSHLIRHIYCSILFASTVLEDSGRFDHTPRIGTVDIQRLHGWLVQYPEHGAHIRVLKFRYWDTIGSDSHPFRNPFRKRECTAQIAAILSSLPNLVSLSIIRWGKNSWDFSLLTAMAPSLPWAWVDPCIQAVFLSVLGLPGLRAFHFHDCYEFETFAEMLESFSCSHSPSIHSLTLRGQRIIWPENMTGLDRVAPFKAKIKTLRLASLAGLTNNDRYCHRFIAILSSPLSPYDIHLLVSLEIQGARSRDREERDWVSDILDIQTNPGALQHISLFDLGGPATSLAEKLKRFTSIRHLTMSFDNSQFDHKNPASYFGDNFYLWRHILPSLPSLEKLSLLWVWQKPFNYAMDIPPLTELDTFFAAGSDFQLKEVIIYVQRTLYQESDPDEVYGEFNLDTEDKDLVKWVEYGISTKVLPLSYQRGLVTVDLSRLSSSL
ncbi:hypothetical protein DL96DRAFT_1816641 [Flagelloscypha sp. PMI_526]|nr:hypothetical protein DL96DRAFT_1816641 [Flagelloscypha sp. PMI_526]